MYKLLKKQTVHNRNKIVKNKTTTKVKSKLSSELFFFKNKKYTYFYES